MGSEIEKNQDNSSLFFLSRILGEIKLPYRSIVNEKPYKNMSFLLPGRMEEDRCVFISNRKYIKRLNKTIKMALVTEDMIDEVLLRETGVCVVDDPRLSFFKIHNYLSTKDAYKRTRFKTIIGKECYISPTASIPSENIVIGDRVVIEDRVSLIGNISIADDSIIHSGSVIGAEGNDYKRYGEKLIRTAQVGGVIIGRGVEVDQNCCIERPTFPYEDTVLGDETKVGALSFIAHGVNVGKRTQIKGMVNIAGYTSIGNDVFIGPGSTISNLISIGDGANITIGSVVVSSVLPNNRVTGNFAIDHNMFMKMQMDIMRDYVS